MGQLAFQAQWNVFIFTWFDVTELHCTLILDILPERAVIVKIYLVESKIVVGQQALQSRIDLDVVIVIDRVHITAAIVDGAFQLKV